MSASLALSSLAFTVQQGQQGRNEGLARGRILEPQWPLPFIAAQSDVPLNLLDGLKRHVSRGLKFGE